MDLRISIVLLVVGFVVGVCVLLRAKKRIRRSDYIPSGLFNIVFGIAAVTPACLIRFDIIQQTTTTVLIAILYFLIFIPGLTFVDAQAIRRKRKENLL